MTPTSPRITIAALMADGRERTTSDVLHRVRGNPDYIRKTLKTMADEGALTAGTVRMDNAYVVTWKASV